MCPVSESETCQKVFTDKASGTLAHRSQLDQALTYLREGDTLVITKLDRLEPARARSVRNFKQVADDLDARGVGLLALHQGIGRAAPRPGHRCLAVVPKPALRPRQGMLLVTVSSSRT